MGYNTRHPRSGTLIALGISLALIWVLSIYGLIDSGDEDIKITKTNYKPAFVSYGTHSTATAPIVSMSSLQRETSVPMLSGGTIRHMAYFGHSNHSSVHGSSGYRLHTTSSATVHSIGSGGGGGGLMSGGSSTSSSSSRIAYSGGSFSLSMPTLAMNTASTALAQNKEVTSDGDLLSKGRNRMPSNPGTYEGETATDSEGHWRWDGEDWIKESDLTPGETMIDEYGKTWRWNGSSWELVSDQQDPGMPVGSMPWIAMGLMALVYALYRRKKQLINE